MSSQPDNITIYSPGGTPLRTVSFDSNAEQVEELMRADYVQLHWESTGNTELPAGAYITFGGRKFTLLDPYSPEQADELQHTYTPQFQSRIMEWGKIPYFHYNQAGGSTTPEREPDWSLTANASTHLASVVAALAAEGQGTWTVEIDDAMRALGATTISFQATDIFSGLNSIASAFEGEWWARENTSGVNGGKIYFARRIARGTAIDLTVGSNVGVPSVTTSKEGYYNRFYVFGSTRNITQDYAGANVNALVNKRLTLDPTKYPGSYIDTRKDTKEPIFSRFLTFDDIYPRAHLNIPNTTLGLRARIMYRIDEATSLPKVIGTNSEGEPVYDQYVAWYFRPVVSDTGAEFTITDPTTYDPETNPTGELIKGKTLSVHFSSGLLNGREFELRFVDKNETLKGQSFPALGLSTPDFATYKGDFEIKYIEEGSMIVPTDISGGVHPQVGDVLTLFNLRMPASYISSSQKDLEEAAQETIAERYDADLNNYTLPSNQVAFCKNDPGLTVGHAVKYTNGAYSYETRVIRIVRKLDTPNYCEQEITIGSEKIKGDRQTLREDVVDVNRNIEQLAALNSLTETIAQSYARAQQVMLDAIARSADIWRLDDEGNAYTERNVYSLKEITALGNGGSGGSGSGGTGGASYFWELADVDVSSAVKNDIPVYNGSKWVNTPMASLRPDLTGYATEAWVKSQGYLTQHQSLAGYATQQWVEGKGYALASDLGGYLPLTGGTLTGPLTMGGNKPERIYFRDQEHFIELDADGNFHFSHNVYSSMEISALGYQAGSGGGAFSGALSDLTDVKLSGLVNGDLLQWNGTDWVNVKASELGIGGGAVDLSNYVTLDTAQEIKGAKTFTNVLRTNSYAYIGATQSYAIMMGGSANYTWIDCRQGTTVINKIVMYPTYTYFGKNIKAPAFVKDGGTSAQFLMADGSVNEDIYLREYRAAANTNIDTLVNHKPFIAEIYSPTGTLPDSSMSTRWMQLFNWGNRDTHGDVSYGTQMASHYTSNGSLYFRNIHDNTIEAWRTLLDTVNYASLIDARYVKKSGDTMTGPLTMSASDTTSRYARATNSNGAIELLAATNRGVYNRTHTKWLIATDPTGQYVWSDADLFGFGTTNPLDKLHVHDGNIRVSYATDNRYMKINCGGFAFYATSTTGWAGGLNVYTNSGTSLGVSAGYYGNKDALNYMFYGGTYTSPAMVILPDKKIGIGTTAPAAAVHINASFASKDTWINALRIRAGIGTGKYVYLNIGAADGTNNAGNIDYYYAGAQSTSNYLGFGFNSNNNLMVLLATGSLLLGTKTNSSGAKLHVAGTIYATGEITALSDRRVKSDIRTLPFRGALIPRTYIKDGRRQIGFIAQEANEVYPELVNKGVTPEALWSFNYQSATAVLAAWCNVHDDEIAKLNRRVTQVENELKAYRRA